MSKGSTARPLSIPREQFGERHTAIFGERKRVRWVPPGEDEQCKHEHLIARPEDDMAIMRCIACGDAVDWLRRTGFSRDDLTGKDGE